MKHSSLPRAWSSRPKYGDVSTCQTKRLSSRLWLRVIRSAACGWSREYAFGGDPDCQGNSPAEINVYMWRSEQQCGSSPAVCRAVYGRDGTSVPRGTERSSQRGWAAYARLRALLTPAESNVSPWLLTSRAHHGSLPTNPPSPIPASIFPPLLISRLVFQPHICIVPSPRPAATPRVTVTLTNNIWSDAPPISRPACR